jgi:anaerobic magnesium-protoporphyrin IX monomethyl ester cyclase
MAKVLFTHSYFLRFDPKQWKQQQPYAPLGTITAAALMRQNGYEVNLHDTMFCVSPDEIIPVFEEMQPDYLVIYDDGFNYLTKMCLTNMREAAYRLVEIGKKYGCRVILSSSDSTDHYTQYLEKGADFIIIGEGEMALLDILNNCEAGHFEFKSIPGIAFIHHGECLKTTPRQVIQKLDALPIAAWDLIDLNAYRAAWINKYGYFSINIATTRGCPYKCNWCAKPIYGNRYNSRTPEHVINELLYLQNRVRLDHIWFCDDIFGLKPGWIKEFGRLVKESGLKFRFKIQSRVDILLKDNMLLDLKEAGCDQLWLGVESGSQKILDAMDKGITVAQTYETTKRVKALGMKPAFFLQFGYPGEKEQDIAATIKMLTELMPYDIGVSVAYPLPGTKFYEKVKNELTSKANWTDSDELAMMFNNTYKPGYYKSLQRFVHKKFRKEQAFEAIRNIFSGIQKPTRRTLYKAASSAYYIPAEIIAAINLKFTGR